MSAVWSEEQKNTQRTEALARGNQIRLDGVAMGRRVTAGEVSILVLIADPPDCIRHVGVNRLLMWLPKVGPVKARAVLVRIPGLANHSLAVGKLRADHRAQLIAILRDGSTNGMGPIA